MGAAVGYPQFIEESRVIRRHTAGSLNEFEEKIGAAPSDRKTFMTENDDYSRIIGRTEQLGL